MKASPDVYDRKWALVATAPWRPYLVLRRACGATSPKSDLVSCCAMLSECFAQQCFPLSQRVRSTDL